MEQVLLVIQVIIAVGLIGMVLIQRSESDGFGLGGGGGGVLSGRTQANLMTRTTAILAALFIINSLALDVLASQGTHSASIADTIEQQQKTDANGAPVVPTDADAKPVKADTKAASVEKKADVKAAAPLVPNAGTDEGKPVVNDAAPQVTPTTPVKKAPKKAAVKAEPATDEAPADADHNE